MNNRKLTWRHLKGLNKLYASKRVGSAILDNSYIKSVLLEQKKMVRYKSGNVNVLEATSSYEAFYKQNFEADYDLYEGFLLAENLESDAKRRYTESDIQTMMFIAEHKNELIKNLTTIRTFSSEMFKGQGSKYLENKSGLKDAVCKILGIVDFPDRDPKDHQWRCAVDCLNPRLIILCENLAPLKNPWKARENDFELWYVGGNNIGIVDHISFEKLSKPVYYSCDWDYHGLSIYSRLKQKLQSKSCDIQLLIPYDYETALSVNSPHHKSEWDYRTDFSGLILKDFSPKASQLIKKLIAENKWIEEESLDLLKMVDVHLNGQ